LSFGVLDALTGEETATIDDGAGNRTTRIVEPTTNYGMLRLKQDFNRGASSVGAGLTAVNRTASGAEAVALHDQAYAGGLQLTHRFARDMYGLDARLFGSYVHGSADAIDRTQRAPQRYYQRPDAKHVDYDPTRTSLSGMGLVWSIGKIGGEHWRFIAGNDLRTPGLEMNDLGFQQFSDSAAHQAVGQYRDDKPGDYLQSFNLSARGSVTTDFAPDLSYASASIDGSMTLRNFWSLSAGASMDRVFLSTIALRGGPALAGFDAYSASLGGLSDSRKPVRGSVNVNARTVPETGTRSLDADLQLVVQARANLEISVGPLVSRRINGDQYVTEAMNTQTSGMEYILARLDQTTVALTARLNYTFSPSLSLQLYAQPFLSTGVYGRYKAVIAPRARRHEDRFHVFSDADATLQGAVYEVDRDGDGTSEYSFAPADFNFRQMRSNLVFRWEYRPGSTLFLVWSHQRSSEDATGRFDLGSELGALAREPGEHVILAKLSYWYAL
jgi:hypothetical protein